MRTGTRRMRRQQEEVNGVSDEGDEVKVEGDEEYKEDFEAFF